jgi:hypothetical protein
MQIFATNLSTVPIINLALNYINSLGAPTSETVNLPAKPSGSSMASMVTASQPASLFTSIIITLGGTPYTVPFGQSLPSGLGVQVEWSQDPDAAIVIITEDGMGS